jgi:hypothetical protein
MERIEYRELETFHFGGFPITVVTARAGTFIALIGSGTCETAEDTLRKAKELRAKLDKFKGQSQNTGSSVEQSGSSQGS